MKVNDLIIPLRHKLDNGSLMFKVGIQISFLTEEEQQLVYEQMMELHVKLTMEMAIKLREMCIRDRAKSYVDNWEEMKRNNIGCLFWGPVGTDVYKRQLQHCSIVWGIHSQKN